MRLRRETGDFEIVVGQTESIRKGLSVEDLIGMVITDENGAYVVNKAVMADGTISLTYDDKKTIGYDPKTGEVKNTSRGRD